MRQLGQFVDGFVVSFIFVELFACTIVVLTVLALVSSPSSADTSSRYRAVRLPALPTTSPSVASLPEPYVTITEFASDSATPAPAEVGFSTLPQTNWPKQPIASPLLPKAATTEKIPVKLPITGSVSQGFGCSPYYTGIPGPSCAKSQPWFHDGIDIAARQGVPVRAGLAGVVIFAGPDGDGPLCGVYRGYGLAVVVDNGDGWQALYGHLSEISVIIGQVVTPETVLGLTGDTGCTTGPHLHFGLRHDGVLVDPGTQLARNKEQGTMSKIKNRNSLFTR